MPSYDLPSGGSSPFEPFSQLIVPTILALNKAANPRRGGFRNVPLGWQGSQPIYEQPYQSGLGGDAGALMMNVFQNLIAQGQQSAAQGEFQKALSDATNMTATGGGAMNSAGPYGAPTQLAPVQMSQNFNIMDLIRNPKVQNNPMLEPFLANSIRGAQFQKLQEGEPYTLNPGDVRYGGNNQPIAFGLAPQTRPTKPESTLLRSTNEDVPGVGKVPVDYYGYKDESGKEVVLDRKFGPHASAVSGVGVTPQDDVTATAAGIIDGTLPPDISRMVSFRDRTRVAAELKKKGFDLTTANRDWTAVQKHMNSLNSATQLRLQQAITFADETLPQLQAAYDEWKKQAGTSGIKLFNKANLALMKNMPGAAGSAATNLEALINDYTSELAYVYRGGNASTDESLKLAATNLQGDWNDLTFTDALKRLKRTIKIRKNSILNSVPAGITPGSPYVPQSQGQPAEGQTDLKKKYGLE